MKKLLVLLLLPLLLCGCMEREREEEVLLEVKKTTWSVRTADGDPVADTAVYAAEADLVIPSDTSILDCSFTVVSVSDTEIRICSDADLSVKERDKGINLFSTEREFVIPYGQTVTLATPTLDAGIIYELSYLPRGG